MKHISEMTGTEKVKQWWDGKTNNSPKAKKLKKRLEELGHKDVHVWWEPLGPAYEMCGNEGGYMYVSNFVDNQPIGYTFKEALEIIEKDWNNPQTDFFYITHHISKEEGEEKK